MKRISSIDLMRGIVMIIMALDHVRDMMHTSSIVQKPADLNTTTALLFFTRWITHLCAPTFVFLSGVSASISMKRHNDIRATRRFLLTRGLWLVVLEFTLVNFAIWFDVRCRLFIFEVIATIGVGFMILSLLARCSTRTIAAVGLAIVFLHNLAPLVPGGEGTLFKKGLMPLFAPAAFPFGERLFIMGYPPIPWLGIMLVGFACGRLFELELSKQKTLFLKIGLASIGLFVVLRLINVYGDSVPWSQQKTGLFTFLSFINLTKYPPSLDFCLVFLGMMFLILSVVTGKQNKWSEIASIYGRTPLFYFLLHLYVIHLLTFAMLFLQGFKGSDLVFGFNMGRPKAPSGLPLWGVYLVWITVVVVMYPLCRRYGKYKGSHKEKGWLRYL